MEKNAADVLSDEQIIKAITSIVGNNVFSLVLYGTVGIGQKVIPGHIAGIFYGICRKKYRKCGSNFESAVRRHFNDMYSCDRAHYIATLPDTGLQVRIATPTDVIQQLLGYAYSKTITPDDIKDLLEDEDIHVYGYAAYEVYAAADALAWLYCKYGESFRKVKYCLDSEANYMFDMLYQPAKYLYNQEKDYYTKVCKSNPYNLIISEAE